MLYIAVRMGRKWYVSEVETLEDVTMMENVEIHIRDGYPTIIVDDMRTFTELLKLDEGEWELIKEDKR